MSHGTFVSAAPATTPSAAAMEPVGGLHLHQAYRQHSTLSAWAIGAAEVRRLPGDRNEDRATVEPPSRGLVVMSRDVVPNGIGEPV